MSDLGFIQSSPKREYMGMKTIRSLSIKQLHQCEVDNQATVTYLNESEVATIKIMGWVSNVKVLNNGKAFLLEDGTGLIDCTMWNNKPIEEYMISQIEENAFVKIIGILRENSNKKSVQATSLYLVEDYNELTYHFSNIIREHLLYSKKEAPEKKEIFKKVHTEILSCIRKNQDPEEGLPLKAIIKCLQNEYSEKTIVDSLEFLVDNCYLTVTSDGSYLII